MPSPVGHALGGVSAGILVLGRRPLLRDGLGRRDLLVLAGFGMLPDVDLLVGMHSGPTHGIGAAVIAALGAVAIGGLRLDAAVAVAAAYASHTLLDWLGSDTSPPIGIMALWPLSRQYFQSELRLFHAVSRRYWLPEQFIWGNLRSLARELLILGPITVIAMIWRHSAGSRPPASSSHSAPLDRSG